MTYRLEFLPSAQKEWETLGATVRSQFTKKLRERLETPSVPSTALHGMPDCYKIKLRQSGYRLVYRVIEMKITVLVVAVGKQERGEVYDAAGRRQ
jgi:mRNA interferase RelE/StbE